MKTVTVIRHVAFEDLGTLAGVFHQRGLACHTLEAGIDPLTPEVVGDPDLLVVLGGPIGAGDEDQYPFLRDTLALLQHRLAAQRPTLGLCLGAQLMARALGARVYRAAVPEIGWQALTPTLAGQASPLAALIRPDLPVFHWHGDTFDLPTGATLLAATPACHHQAYTWGAAALGLQCHPEVQATGLERWLIGHAAELAAAGIAVTALREDNHRLAPALEVACRTAFDGWLASVGL
ncbi:GMP synthase-Glutamine amidotransferase domain [Gulbenkiania indica]|uniref:GMP synthase-Glutamine amidotransferase domain n=1 Tax=Gulbenkiania indica TaxID=375574 RepID=A0A0K6GS88_9NEIS|nr:glutamine amidotransferase [Gulbenkiania indica]CUA81396.1 GMP synthase-Glutamine amidotransferase domain [Gulbenkiania indica]